VCCLMRKLQLYTWRQVLVYPYWRSTSCSRWAH
jgi:hypothetical protein